MAETAATRRMSAKTFMVETEDPETLSVLGTRQVFIHGDKEEATLIVRVTDGGF